MNFKVGQVLEASEEVMWALPVGAKVNYTYFSRDPNEILEVVPRTGTNKKRLRSESGGTYSGDCTGQQITIVSLPNNYLVNSINLKLVLKALEQYSKPENWSSGGPLDFKSPNFVGIEIAKQALGLLGEPKTANNVATPQAEKPF